jgi:uncharacterized membrane protein YdjX (TVP38/TMEM64 family)
VIEAINNWFLGFGSLTPTAAIALGLFFLVAALLVFPRTLLIVSAGATFGPTAAPIILMGATVGSMIAFLLSRYVASAWFRKKLNRRPMLRAIAQAVDDEGWRIVALVRLGAPVPSTLQGYAFGLTKIGFLPYVVATFIFSAPQIFLFTFLGATGRSSIINDSSLSFGLVLSTIIGTVAAVALIGWRVRILLRSRVDSIL